NAGVQTAVAEDRMDTPAEAGTDGSDTHGLAPREVLGAGALLVIVVDDAVIAGAEAIEALGHPAKGECREQNFGIGGVAVLRGGEGVERLEGVAGRDAGLEVDVESKDADELVDERRRDLLLERRLIDG